MPVNTLKTPDRKELINLATLRDKLSPRLRIYASLPVTYIVNHAKLLHRVLTNVCDHQNSREKSVKKPSAKSSAQEQHHATYWGQHYNTIFRCVSRERYYQKMTLKNRDMNRLRNYCLNRKERVIRQEFSKVALLKGSRVWDRFLIYDGIMVTAGILTSWLNRQAYSPLYSYERPIHGMHYALGCSLMRDAVFTMRVHVLSHIGRSLSPRRSE